MGTPFTPGQFGKLQSIVSIGIATALPRVSSKFEPKSTLKAFEGRGDVFAGRLEALLEQALNSMLVLAPRSATTIMLDKWHDPDTYYQTRSGLYVWGDFRPRIVAHAMPIPAGTTFKVKSFDLTVQLTDREIEDVLPKAHFFDEKQVCGTVAGLIAKQAIGEEGELLNNGFANLFYTGSCVVDVSWSAGVRGWDVDTWRRDVGRWSAGNRVFSPGN